MNFRGWFNKKQSGVNFKGTNIMSDLSTIREIWLAHYRQGDVEGLQQFEASNLTVVNDGIVESSNRYQKIKQSVSDGLWFQPQMKTVVSYEDQGGQTEVVGYCEIISGKHIGLRLQIEELWRNHLGQWQLTHLSINS